MIRSINSPQMELSALKSGALHFTSRLPLKVGKCEWRSFVDFVLMIGNDHSDEYISGDSEALVVADLRCERLKGRPDDRLPFQRVYVV
jgi:hypothetical protein